MNAWTVDPSTGFEDMFCQLRDAGFDGVELNVDGKPSAHSLTMETDASDLCKIRTLSEKYDLPVVSISSSLYGDKLGSADPQARLFGGEILKKQLQCAEALGADGILVVPGGISDTVSLYRAWNNSIMSITTQKPAIEAAKINVGVENVWNAFFTSPFDMCSFIDAFECPYIGAYFDVGNVVAFSSPENWIEILGDRIKKIHVKDFKRNSSINSGGEWKDITHGDVNWQKVIPSLRAAGYDGYLTAEVFKEDSSQSFIDYYAEVSRQLDTVISY